MKKGFTLIELLVVVLIIGILAAVALPQYHRVVEKSRASTAYSILKAIGVAQEEFYIANGTYATKFDELTLDLPLTGTEKWSTMSGLSAARSNKDWSFQLYPTINAVFAGRLTGPYKGAGLAYYYGDWACKGGGSYGACAHTMTCVVKKDAGGGVTSSEATLKEYCKNVFKASYTVQSGTIGWFYAMQ